MTAPPRIRLPQVRVRVGGEDSYTFELLYTVAEESHKRGSRVGPGRFLRIRPDPGATILIHGTLINEIGRKSRPRVI